jgi:hypothetical protein
MVPDTKASLDIAEIIHLSMATFFILAQNFYQHVTNTQGNNTKPKPGNIN